MIFGSIQNDCLGVNRGANSALESIYQHGTTVIAISKISNPAKLMQDCGWKYWLITVHAVYPNVPAVENKRSSF